MPSMLGRSSAVPLKAYSRSPPLILSKALAGKLVSDEQPCHAEEKSVPSEVSIDGKLSSDEQPNHAEEKVVPLEVSIKGKLSSDEQLRHALEKPSPLDVLINGNSVISE